MRRDKRFTIFDAMEARGDFDANSANASSPEYANNGGPVQYPKMLYHPTGETRVTVPGELVDTRLGPKLVGEQKELIWQAANNAREEKMLRQQGWHDHPAKAVAAGGGIAPPMSSEQRINDLELEIKRLQLEANEARGLRAAELQQAKVQSGVRIEKPGMVSSEAGDL